MTVAIVHYHLGPGGVSKVIAAASRCLADAGIRHVILAGSASEDLPVRVLPELGYREGREVPDHLLDRLRAAATEALGQPPDIWHFHNHSLGKNRLVPELVARLAEENERLVLQLHDLAEDGRPANYHAIADCPKLYPVSKRIHYAFLNSRDQNLFTSAGLPPEHSTLLPNPISSSLGALDGLAANLPPILFAPVRGIRRKNLGELVFLSAIAPAGVRIAISRAPLNPDALAIHDTWRKFAERQRLPIGFDVVDRLAPAAGASADYDSWLAHASHFVTTSVAEGFGLPFLEAAALGKPLVGRNLAHLTADHERHDIRAGDLYDRLLVPIEWIDATILRDHLETTLERNHRAYGKPLAQAACDAAFSALAGDGWLDFGNLPEPLQQGVIERLADPHCRKTPLVSRNGKTRPAEEWLAAAIANRTPSVTAEQLAPYSIDLYREKLVALYARLMDRPPSPARFLTPTAILDAHLKPDSFHFLLSALPPKPVPWTDYRAVIFDIYGPHCPQQ